MKLSSYCREYGREALLSQWHPEKNGGLRPEQVEAGSHKAVWWRCPLGHEWRAEVRSRTVAHTDCPVCSNRIILSGFNDLATRFPQLTREWDRERNGPLTPEGLAAGSHAKAWWTCARGHHWQAMVCTRTQNDNGCPVCAGKVVLPGENDLATVNPEVASQWHPAKNGGLTPREVSAGSNRRVWWRCPQGHEWRAVIAHRGLHGVGCPYCSNRKVLPGFNDLETTFPELAAQWHPELNGTLTPRMVTPGANRMIWWKCPEGHVWKAKLYSRTGRRRCGCPVCAGVRKTQGG